jgi:hypothetical protein
MLKCLVTVIAKTVLVFVLMLALLIPSATAGKEGNR